METQSILGQIRETLYAPLFQRPWPIWGGALAFAGANILMAAYARGLGVFPQMSMWGASLYNLLGIKTEGPFYPSALLSREFKIRTDSWWGYGQGLLGGVLMGFGTVITPPCNVGGFGTAVMAFSLSGFLMALGMLPGAYLGGRILFWQADRAVAHTDLGQAPQTTLPSKSWSSRQPLLGWFALFALLGVAGLYAVSNQPAFAGLLLFETLFGIIFQRSRLCFASAFRDVFITRETGLLRWIVVSLLVGMVGFAILKSRGFVAADHFVFPAGSHTVVGGYIFGIGMVLAGGCGAGILWRSAESYVRHWFSILGGMMAAGSWVHIYGNKVGKGWLYDPKVFLPDALGWAGALALVGLALAAFYVFLTWVEVRKR